MAQAAKHPCPHPGCGVLVGYGTTYCPIHQAEYEQRRRDSIERKASSKRYDATKRPEAKFYHSTRWARLRKWFIRKNPLCVHCMRDGRVTAARVIDHVVEIADGGQRYDIDNLQALCHACHNRKTADERAKREK